MLGIDVSKWQKEIDWDKVKNEGVDFAIIRCGYRGSVTGSLVEDPYFEQNIKGARAAGIKVGVYFFTQAVNEVEAVEEASMVISLVRDYEAAVPRIHRYGRRRRKRQGGCPECGRRVPLVCEAFCTHREKCRIWRRACMPAATGTDNKLISRVHWSPTPSGLRSTGVCPCIRAITRCGSIHQRDRSTDISGNVDMNVSYGGFE